MQGEAFEDFLARVLLHNPPLAEPTQTEFALTAGWGSGGQGRITMPGKGKTETRAATVDEQHAGYGTVPTLDVYLNATAYWKNVPQPVWDFTIGGYQVMKNG